MIISLEFRTLTTAKIVKNITILKVQSITITQGWKNMGIVIKPGEAKGLGSVTTVVLKCFSVLIAKENMLIIHRSSTTIGL